METSVAIRSCAPHDTEYENVCTFASSGYKKRYNIHLESYPDVFVYAHQGATIVGCFGGYYGSIHQPLTTEWYVSRDDLSKCLNEPIERFPRKNITEIGTRVVDLPQGSGTNSVRISVAMSAALLIHLYNLSGHVALFTADRSVGIIARQLNVNLNRLGRPNLERRDRAYRQKWQAYFEVPRECFLINLAQASFGCYEMLRELEKVGFEFESGLSTPAHSELKTAA